VYVSVALAAGFLVMTASNFTATRSFGVFSAFVMIVAMVAELALTPILLYGMPLARQWGPVAPKARGKAETGGDARVVADASSEPGADARVGREASAAPEVLARPSE
jgi:hypothetical protein